MSRGRRAVGGRQQGVGEQKSRGAESKVMGGRTGGREGGWAEGGACDAGREWGGGRRYGRREVWQEVWLDVRHGGSLTVRRCSLVIYPLPPRKGKGLS